MRTITAVEVLSTVSRIGCGTLNDVRDALGGISVAASRLEELQTVLDGLVGDGQLTRNSEQPPTYCIAKPSR